MRGARVVATVVAAAGFALGCGTEPPRLAGTYLLRSIDGVALPVTVEIPGWGSRRWVRGSMTILPAGHFQFELYAEGLRNGVVVGVDTLEYPASISFYRWTGANQVEFYACCRPSSTGFADDTIDVGIAVMERDTLRLTGAGLLDTTQHVLRFTH